MIIEKIEFVRAGSFFSETHVCDAAEYTTPNGSVRWPEHAEVPWCYAWRRFRLSETEVTDDFGAKQVHQSRGDVGPWTYRGNVWTLDQVETALARGDSRVTRVLRDNMKRNGWSRVLECRQGMIPLLDDSVTIVPDEKIPAAA